MDGLERLLKFGLGFIAYIILALVKVPFSATLITGLIPCLIIALAILFYGKEVVKPIS